MLELSQVIRFFHEKSLGMAIFFGRTEWADCETRALGYSALQRRTVLMEVHTVAARRSEIIRGDWDQAEYHSGEWRKLAEDEQAESLWEYNQPQLL